MTVTTVSAVIQEDDRPDDEGVPIQAHAPAGQERSGSGRASAIGLTAS